MSQQKQGTKAPKQNNNKAPAAEAAQASESNSETAVPEISTLSLGPAPSLQFATHTKTGVSIYTSDDDYGVSKDTDLVNGIVECVLYSPNGKLLAIALKDRVEIYDTFSLKLHCTIAEPSVHNIHFSHRSTYLVTLGKYNPQEVKGNCAIWQLMADGTVNAALRYDYKQSSDELWPIVQFNDADTLFTTLHMDQTLDFYVRDQPNQQPQEQQQEQEQQETADGESAATTTTTQQPTEQQPTASESTLHKWKLDVKMKNKKVLWYSLSPKSTVAIYTPAKTGETKTKPGVYTYRYPNIKKPTSIVNFEQAPDTVDFKWNKQGLALLVQTTAQVDNSDKSYYGENKLYLLKQSFSCLVDIKTEGQVHDVQWSPKGNEFIAVYGPKPAKMKLFNDKAQDVWDFGAAARNKVSWSPSARFLCFAGFGNFKGGMEFWDREKKKKLGTNEASDASWYSWSPDSSRFMTATLTPVLRVQNKFQLWKYNGVLKHEQQFETLYKVLWRPVEDVRAYPARAPSPRGLKEGKVNEEMLQQSEKKTYVPPSLRKAYSYTPLTNRPIPGAVYVDPVPQQPPQQQPQQQRPPSQQRPKPQGAAPPQPRGGAPQQKKQNEKRQ